MTTTDRNWKQIIRTSLILIIFVILLGLLAWSIWKALTTLSPQVSAAIVASIATVLISVLSLILSKRADRKREIEQELRREKSKIYEEFIAFLIKAIMSDKLGKRTPTEKEMVQFFAGFA